MNLPESPQQNDNSRVLDGVGTIDLNDVATAADIVADSAKMAKAAMEHVGDIVGGVLDGLSGLS